METTMRRYSRMGRPRTLTEAQIESLRAWHAARITFKEQCQRLGVCPATARKAITGFEYKSAPPEQRPERRRQRISIGAEATDACGESGGAA
jgi:hypothetical protein